MRACGATLQIALLLKLKSLDLYVPFGYQLIHCPFKAGKRGQHSYGIPILDIMIIQTIMGVPGMYRIEFNGSVKAVPKSQLVSVLDKMLVVYAGLV